VFRLPPGVELVAIRLGNVRFDDRTKGVTEAVFECTSSDGSHFERTVEYVPDGVMYEVLVDQSAR